MTLPKYAGAVKILPGDPLNNPAYALINDSVRVKGPVELLVALEVLVEGVHRRLVHRRPAARPAARPSGYVGMAQDLVRAACQYASLRVAGSAWTKSNRSQKSSSMLQPSSMERFLTRRRAQGAMFFSSWALEV